MKRKIDISTAIYIALMIVVFTLATISWRLPVNRLEKRKSVRIFTG